MNLSFLRVRLNKKNFLVLGNPSISRAKPPRPPMPPALRTVASPQRNQSLPFSCPSPHTFNYGPPSFADPSASSGGGDSETPWTCTACTFKNHPLLNKCEQCEVPRIPPGTQPSIALHQPGFESFQQATTNNCFYQNGGHSPATPYSPTLYAAAVQYAPAFPYTNPELMPPPQNVCVAPNTSNSNKSELQSVISTSVGDLPAAIRSVFKKGHRHTPSM